MEKTTEYVISTWFIPYLMNADSSALLDDEFAQLQEWEEQLVEKAGLTMFSVVENSFQEFAVCEITKEMACTETVRVYRYFD